jgi:hypothetical protein
VPLALLFEVCEHLTFEDAPRGNLMRIGSKGRSP